MHARLTISVTCDSLPCRELSGLKDQSDYVLCLLAADESGNRQAAVTQVPFTTLDGTGPDLTLAPVSAGSQQSTPALLADGSQLLICTLTFAVQLSEPGNATYIVLPLVDGLDDGAPGSNFSNLSPMALLNGTAMSDAGEAYAGVSVTLAAGQLQEQVTVPGLQCESTYQFAAAAQDVYGNVAGSLATLEMQTLDVLPPLFLDGTPAVAATNSSASVQVQLDSAGTVFMQLYLGSVSCGTPASLKASAGVSGTQLAASAEFAVNATELVTRYALLSLVLKQSRWISSAAAAHSAGRAGQGSVIALLPLKLCEVVLAASYQTSWTRCLDVWAEALLLVLQKLDLLTNCPATSSVSGARVRAAC